MSGGFGLLGPAERAPMTGLVEKHATMADTDSSDSRRELAHDARQGLNAIRLTTGNLRVRLPRLLEDGEREWLLAKLEKIDRQVDRLAALLDRPS